MTKPFHAAKWIENSLVLIDQTRLPGKEEWIHCEKVETLIQAIRDLSVRGAPLLGIVGGFGAVLIAQTAFKTNQTKEWFYQECEKLASARPTAVNLRWGVERVLNRVKTYLQVNSGMVSDLLDEAKKIEKEDLESNRLMANWGASLFLKGKSAITVCNTGELCTAGIGTALGVLKEAYRQKKIEHIYALETRPLLQGLRLTAWELEREKIPYTVLCDNMAALVMKQNSISGIIAGADRIVANGDFANKIGTYMLAVLAQYHKIPFFVAAPISSFDLSIADGNQIPIEERNPNEILGILGELKPEKPYSVYNPAFDVTPHELVTAIICEKGVIQSPNREKISEFFKK